MPLTSEGNIPANAAGAILFLSAANLTYQSFGTLNSSPWTIENVGADQEKVRSMVEYNWHAGVSALVLAGIAAWASSSWWPIVGVVLVNVYLMCFIYRRAARRGQDADSMGTGWFGSWGKA